MEILGWSDCDKRRLVSAVEKNIWSLWKTFGVGEESAFHEIHGALCLETPVKSHPYNFVMNFVGGTNPSDQIDRVFRHFDRRETPFLWLITSVSSPANLSDHLEKRGMMLAEIMPTMTARLDNIDTAQISCASDIQITEAVSEDSDDLFHFVSYRWDVPSQNRDQAFALYRNFKVGQKESPIRAWVARRGGAVIGKSILHFGAGVAGVHGVMVLPEARGEGLGRILTLLALRSAKDAGYDVAVLGSSPMAERLYASIGFEKMGELLLYAPNEGFHV